MKKSLSIAIRGIGEVIVYAKCLLLPESELVFIDRKTGKFKMRKFKSLKKKEVLGLFGIGKSKIRTTFIGIKSSQP